MNTLILFFNLIAFSPLDQFGVDADFYGVLDNPLTDFLTGVWYLDDVISFIGVTEIDSIFDSFAILLASAGVLLFDDQDSSDSEWDDASSIISSTQASIFSANIMGMIPGLETTTSEASFAFFLSISMIFSIIIIGFALHNVRYLAILYPTGTPTAMAAFIIVIEFISYIARAVSLGMRLFANMFAGHALVKILMSFAWLFINSALPLISVPVFCLLLVIFLLECGIAYLQSYVFATLSGMYIEDVIALGH